MIPQALLLFLMLFRVPAAGPGVGSVTLLDGSLRVIRGTSVFRGVEGMHLRQGDILESSDGAFVQVEFASGGIVALGPATRVYILQHPTNQGPAEVQLVLLSGWLKGESEAAKGTYRYQSPILAVRTAAGTVLFHSNEKGADIFLESGSASIGQVSPGGNSSLTISAKAGQFISRRTSSDPNTLSRPTRAFVDSMPRQFKDTLPSRLARFAGQSVEPKAEHQVSYVEVKDWLTMPSTWRRGLAERFAPRLSDPEFRKQIELHVDEYPEWDPILHPEKNPETPRARN